MDPGAAIQRILERPRIAYILAVLDTYGRATGGLLANGLAFAALFTAVPIMLLTLGLTGWLAKDPAIQRAVADALEAVVPPLADLIEDTLNSLVSGAALTSVIGLAGTVWGVSQLYVALDVAFSRIWNDHPERDVFHRTARGFLWVAILIAAVIALIVAITVSTALSGLVPEAIPAGRSLSGFLTAWPVLIAAAVGIVALIYRTVPPRPPGWAAVWLPAVVAATAIVVLSQVFARLVPLLVGAAAIVGSLATAFVALAWLSFSFQALLYGAAWVRIRDEGVPGPVASTDGSVVLGTPAPPAEPGGGGE
jgi:YihY family inner membrane protein